MVKIKITVMIKVKSDSLSLNCVLYINCSFLIRQLYQFSIIQNTNGDHWDDDYGAPINLAVMLQTYYGK